MYLSIVILEALQYIFTLRVQTQNKKTKEGRNKEPDVSTYVKKRI
jgi:hypothetical protein